MKMMFILYCILAVIQVILLGLVLAGDSNANWITWTLYSIGALFSVIAMYVAYSCSESGNMIYAYIMNFLTFVSLYGGFINAFSSGDYNNNLLVGYGMHAFHIVMYILMTLALRQCAGETNVSSNEVDNKKIDDNDDSEEK